MQVRLLKMKKQGRVVLPTTKKPFICFSLLSCLSVDMSEPCHSLTAPSLTTITYSLDACQQRVETRFVSSRYARSRYCGSAAGTELSLEGCCVCPWKQTYLARNGTLQQPIRSQPAITPCFSELSVSCSRARCTCLIKPAHTWTKTGTCLIIHPQTCLQQMTCSAARVLAAARMLRQSY